MNTLSDMVSATHTHSLFLSLSLVYHLSRFQPVCVCGPSLLSPLLTIAVRQSEAVEGATELRQANEKLEREVYVLNIKVEELEKEYHKVMETCAEKNRQLKVPAA